ncbi:sporulation related protein [Zymomonas mobilis]|uniref:Sporulation related protein n=1 Tax=Zymomonas mobilis TaxID=542 RepID=A0A542W125_ZYMMB|nr:SPOR domain-containing protein [Zymomonas mobilis]TQL17267.1 sporulation related protein [Zymomonas mobilis]
MDDKDQEHDAMNSHGRPQDNNTYNRPFGRSNAHGSSHDDTNDFYDHHSDEEEGEDDDSLPWLEPVEDDEGGHGGNLFQIIIVALVALLTLTLFGVGLYWWFHRPPTVSGNASLITAEPGPYKTKPREPGGMKIEGEGESAYAASEGRDINSSIDTSAQPEQPMTITPKQTEQPITTPAPVAKARPDTADNEVEMSDMTGDTRHSATARPAPVKHEKEAAAKAVDRPAKVVEHEKPAVAPAKPVVAKAEKNEIIHSAEVAKPKAKEETSLAGVMNNLHNDTHPADEAKKAPASGAGVIQLGAFGSEAKANEVWAHLTQHYGWLKPLPHQVVSVKIGEKTFYRLRATAGGQANSFCSQLQTAGETCAHIGK